MNLPKISVVTITYGHEKYIRETLDGVLMQQYAGPIKFIIANDNSPDQTDEVVKAYFQEHNIPKNFEIKYTRHHENKGMMPNFIWAMEQATGKYIALCEGDDYWTDPLKLQKQVDFLEENEDFVIHSGKVQVLRGNQLMEVIGDLKRKKTYDVSDFLTQNNLVTCTVMLKNNNSMDYTVLYNLAFGDWMLYVLLMNKTNGLAYVSDEQLAVYRVHENGVMNKYTDRYQFNSVHMLQFKAIKNLVSIPYLEGDKVKIKNVFTSLLRHDIKRLKFRKSLVWFLDYCNVTASPKNNKYKY